MTWTPPVHLTSGQQGSSAQMNSQVMDNLSWLYTNPYRLSVHLNPASSPPQLPANTATLIPYDTIDWDMSPSAWASGFHYAVVPVKGYWVVRAGFSIAAVTGACNCSVYVNGWGGVVHGGIDSGTTGGGATGAEFQRELLLNAGDQVFASAWASSGPNNWAGNDGGTRNFLQLSLVAQVP